MRLVVQRVKEASCIIHEKVYSQIEKGYVIFVGFTHTDSKDTVLKAANKIKNLRIFPDNNQKMNKNIVDAKGEIMVISQFTMYADATQGNRPSFTMSMAPKEANELYDEFCDLLENMSLHIKTGQFQEHMEISLINDGPVTIILEF